MDKVRKMSFIESAGGIGMTCTFLKQLSLGLSCRRCILLLTLLLFAPNATYAQCNPAVPDAGAGADVIDCVSATTAGNYVFTSAGDLTVNITGTANTNAGAGGVSLTAGGVDDNLVLVRSANAGGTGGAGNISGTGNTAPAIVNLQSQQGDIDFTTTGGISGAAGDVQYAVRAQSSGTGNVSVNLRGGGVSVGTGAANPGIAGVLATSEGGDVTITQDFNNRDGYSFGANPTITGRLYGIQASTTGSGNLSILGIPRDTGGGGNQISLTSTNAIAGIDASVDSGALRIDVSNSINTNASVGTAIRASVGSGDAAISFLGGTTQGATVLDLTMGGGVTTITAGGQSGLSTPLIGNNLTGLLLKASGGGEIVVNNVDGMLRGRFDLQGFEGAISIVNARAADGWLVTGENRFSEGDVTITNTGSITVSATPGVYVRTTTLDFADAASSRFENGGLIVVGRNNQGNSSNVGGNLELLGLDRFDNSGLILMGSAQLPSSAPGSTTPGLSVSDGYYDDVMIMRNGHYHGEGGRIWIDALLNNVGQSSCARNGEGLEGVPILAANALAGHMRANDCLDFRGSAVTGRTGIIVSDVLPGDRGAYNPAGNVVVDVAGSDPASIDPDAFFIAPEAVGYNPEGGGVIDKGLFIYAMGYDEGSQSFRLYGVESPSSIQLALTGGAANDLWRSTLAPWFSRQRESREGNETPSAGINTWLRGSAQSIDRSVSSIVPAGANLIEFDNSYTQNNSSLTFGIDYGRQVEGSGYWNAGFMFGYARSRIGYDASINDANLEGIQVGFYGSFTSGNFFHNLALNSTWMQLENDVPSLGLVPEGTILGTDLSSIGGQLETGWTFRVSRLAIEPLLSVSWVQSKFDGLSVPADDPSRLGGNVTFDDPKSLRTGLGVRLAMKDIVPSFLPLDVSLTARTARESDGVSLVTIENVGPTAAQISDTLDGTFNQVTGVIRLGNRAGTMEGYLNVDAMMADDYESLGASAGFRLMW